MSNDKKVETVDKVIQAITASFLIVAGVLFDQTFDRISELEKWRYDHAQDSERRFSTLEARRDNEG